MASKAIQLVQSNTLINYMTSRPYQQDRDGESLFSKKNNYFTKKQ